LRSLAAALALLLLAPAGRATAEGGGRKADEVRRQAQACERRGEWLEACRFYDEILRHDRIGGADRDSYLRCLRRYHLARRHRDPAYRQVVSRLTPPQALDVYEQVLGAVASAYVDRGKTRWSALFRHGVEELLFALEEEVFDQEYLTGTPPAVVAALRERLREWLDRRVGSRAEAREQVLAVLRVAQQAGVALRPLTMTAVALEFACGACNALDEYTLFLTPGSQADGAAAGRAKPAGPGLDVAVVGTHLVVTRVFPRGPAREAGLARQDRLVRIDGLPADGLAAETAAEHLRGEAGTAVELEVVSPGQDESRTVRLTRRVVPVPSVEFEMLPAAADNGEMVVVGLMRIASFRDGTPQEVREALASLQTAGVRVLILDLRGNPGGAFKAAVQVAELFLGEGVIVIAQGPFREYNRPFRAEGGSPYTAPLVVLIDGETASAAEVLAGALKDHRRATLVGQTTFGKGSIQCVIPLDKPPLDKMPAGIRITVARLLSPGRHPYTGVGVSPDIPFATEGDLVIAEAKRLLLGMLRPAPPMDPMGMPR
jgi:carboxyl-terminal processing protease